MAYLLLVAGLILLVISGDQLVTSGVSIARKFNIPTIIIGVTIIAFGTSAPELIVSADAAISGYPDISVGNIVGSNIANIGLVLALTAIILPIPVKAKTLGRDWAVVMIATLLMFLFFWDNNYTRFESSVLFLMLVAYLVYTVKSSKSNKEEHADPPKYKLPIAILVLALSIVGLFGGAQLFVKSAVGIAQDLGVSERVISITLVAFGTSVPELATSIIAALKKETDISIGNIIGSNLFNILAVMGLTGIIQPFEISNFSSTYLFDFSVMTAFAVVLLLMIIPLSKGKLHRWKGAILLAGYLTYIYMTVSAG